MAVPSLRRMTKSSRSRPWKLIRPCTASSQAISSSCSKKRIVNGVPARTRSSTSVADSR